MASLKKTGTDFSSAQGMDPKAFFEVMGLQSVIDLDAQAGGKAFEHVYHLVNLLWLSCVFCIKIIRCAFNGLVLYTCFSTYLFYCLYLGQMIHQK